MDVWWNNHFPSKDLDSLNWNNHEHIYTTYCFDFQKHKKLMDFQLNTLVATFTTQNFQLYPTFISGYTMLYLTMPVYCLASPVLAEHAHPATRHQFSRTGLQSGCSSLPSGRVFGNPHMKTVQDWLCVTGPHIAWFASKAPRPCPRRRIPFQGVSQECESGHSWCILPRMPSKTAVGQASWRFQLHCMEWPLQEAYGFCQWLLALYGSDGICSRTHGAKHAKLMLFCVH